MLGVLLSLAGGGSTAAPAPDAAPARVAPASFVENSGRFDERVRFTAPLPGATAFVLDGALVFDACSADGARRGAFTLHFESTANDGVPARAAGGCALAGRVHDPARGRTSCTFEDVFLRRVAPGIDVRVRLVEETLEYDVFAQSGADLGGLRLRLDGARFSAPEASGAVAIHGPLGDVVQLPPQVAFTLGADGARPQRVRTVLLDERTLRFEAPGRPLARPLVVDPGLLFSTYLARPDEDLPVACAFGLGGDVIVVSETASFDFPTTMGAFDAQLDGLRDVAVTALRSNGSELLWSTFLGGSADERACDVFVDPQSGVVTVVGTTFSNDFPTTAGAFDTTLAGFADAFVARLAADGSTLLAATLLGGPGFDLALAGDVSPFGVTVGGSTNQSGFPTSAMAWQTTFAGGPFGAGDGFAARLAPDLSALVWSTYVGRNGADFVQGLATAANGETFLAGGTQASGFPGGGAQALPGGAQDGFVLRLAADGRTSGGFTYLGRAGDESIVDLALDGAGRVIALGETTSADLPVSAGALQAQFGGERDAFLARLPADLGTIEWLSYLGGESEEFPKALALGSGDEPLAVGGTWSRFFPTTTWSFDWVFNGPFPVGQGAGDAFLARLSADGGQLLYGMFLGSSRDETARDVAVASFGGVDEALLCGETLSFQFPVTPGVYGPVPAAAGLADGWCARLDFARYPFVYGASKPTSQLNDPYCYVAGFPSVSGAGFSISIDGAEPNTGFTILLESAQPADVPFFGGRRLVAHPFRRIAQAALGFFGSATVPIVLDPAAIGQTRYYQFWFRDPQDAVQVGLSNAVEVTYFP